MAGGKKYKFKTEEEGDIVPLIGVLVVLIILVAGALYVIVTSGAGPEEPPVVAPPLENDTNVTEPINQTNVTNLTQVCDDDCHYQNALMNESADECKKIENGTLMDICYGELSDVSLAACLEVRDQKKKDYCVTSFAVSKDDIDLCDLLDTAARQSCRESVDSCIGSDDEELCRALKDEDPSKCLSDTGCLLNYSMQKQNSSSCSLIQNPVVATGCESAIKKTDKCDALSLASQRDYCYQIYAQYSDDYLVCTQISENSDYKVNCLSMFAASEGNYTICTRGMLQLDDRWACYTNYSLGTGDISGCEAIDELASTNRFKCSFEFAKKYGDPSACQVIVSLGSRDTCYQGTIIYSNDNLQGENCKDVTDFNWRNKCYNEAAKISGDVTLCDEIEETFAKQACIDAFDLAN